MLYIIYVGKYFKIYQYEIWGNKKSEYKEKTYYFCAPGCKKEFDNNPEKYIGKWILLVLDIYE